MNIIVIINSIFGLGFIALSYFVHWSFILPAIALVFWNQHLLLKKSKK